MNFDTGLFTGQVPPESDATPSERYRDLLELGPLVEDRGFEKAWVSEHHFVEDGYLPGVMPFSAALGARTSDLRVGTGIALAPFYDPIRFAEDAAVIDLLTGGRFEVGLAIGWTDEEFKQFDVPKERRVAYLRELVDVLGAAADDGLLSYDGDVYTFEDLDIRPKPIQDELPIWIAGTVDAAVERAARIGDGYFATPTELDELARRQALAESVHDGSEDFPIAEWRYTYVSAERDAWETAKQHVWYIKRQYIEWATGKPQPRELPAEMEDDLRAECLVGTPTEVREQVERRRERLGDSYRLVTRMTLPGLSIEDIRRSVDLFGTEVIDELV